MAKALHCLRTGVYWQVNAVYRKVGCAVTIEPGQNKRSRPAYKECMLRPPTCCAAVFYSFNRSSYGWQSRADPVGASAARDGTVVWLSPR